MSHWIVIGTALLYLVLLFLVAYYGDQRASTSRPRPVLYSLSLAIYCTTWSIFGTTAQTAETGWWLMPTYFGAIIFWVFFWQLLQRIARIAHQQNITSIADFIAARFGKSPALSALVAVVALVSISPYIALQLQALADSYLLLTADGKPNNNSDAWQFDTALYIALIMALFTILFGTRRVDTTEHHSGVMLAIGLESVVKLFAMLIVGAFVVYGVFDGWSDIWQQATNHPSINQVIERRQPSAIYLTQALLGFIAMVCLPRHFHVSVIENRDSSEISRARWLFPGYLVLINIFILPVAMAGLLMLESGTLSDLNALVISIPMSQDQDALALLAFIGGLSAGTSMVIMATIVLSTMLSNEIVVPWFYKIRLLNFSSDRIQGYLLTIRRVLILLILLLAYGYYRLLAEDSQLTTTGLISFALIGQLMPTLIATIFWRRATAKGAFSAILLGSLVCSYTLLLPQLGHIDWINSAILADGPFSISWLHPEQLFGLYGTDSLTHGVFWSLSLNTICLVWVSRLNQPSVLEKIQASRYTADQSSFESMDTQQLSSQFSAEELVLLLKRFLGESKAENELALFCRQHQLTSIAHANPEALFTAVERALTAVIGASTTKLVLTTLKQPNVPLTSIAPIVKEASEVLQFNRELLQAAVEHISHGISVVDKELKLVAWNQRYLDLFDYPAELIQQGRPVADLVRYNAERGECGPGNVEDHIKKRIDYMRQGSAHVYERVRGDGRVLEMRGNPMPGGGFVTSFIDITEFRQQQAALRMSNIELETRVKQRTEELEKTLGFLHQAKDQAEQASRSKSRFLAAASHDIRQPLNAANLFLASLKETIDNHQHLGVIEHINQSLVDAEGLLSDLLEVSKIEAGVVTSQTTPFSVSTLFDELAREFEPVVKQHNLTLRRAQTSLWVNSDRRMVKRVLQNLLSNAIKYSKHGAILLGVRRKKYQVELFVADQGVGISSADQRNIFDEFTRLEITSSWSHGHGLGLAIAQGFAKLLNSNIQLDSEVGRGSCFRFQLPRCAPSDAVIAKPASHEIRQLDLTHIQFICIDNDPKILTAMSQLLNQWQVGHVTVSTDGNIDENIISRQSPAIILADYHLDHGSLGTDVVAQLEPLFDVLATIVISADLDTELRQAVQQKGYYFLSKPVKPLALKSLLKTILSQAEITEH